MADIVTRNISTVSYTRRKVKEEIKRIWFCFLNKLKFQVILDGFLINRKQNTCDIQIE